MKVKQKEIELKQIGHTEVEIVEQGSDAYSIFVYATRSQVTRDYYLRRLRIFFNHINLLPGGQQSSLRLTYTSVQVLLPGGAALRFTK